MLERKAFLNLIGACIAAHLTICDKVEHIEVDWSELKQDYIAFRNTLLAIFQMKGDILTQHLAYLHQLLNFE